MTEITPPVPTAETVSGTATPIHQPEDQGTVKSPIERSVMKKNERAGARTGEHNNKKSVGEDRGDHGDDGLSRRRRKMMTARKQPVRKVP
jgi:hypothetical protein